MTQSSNTETTLSRGQAEAMARGLLAVARSEGGIHEREVAMIKSFYGDATGVSGQAMAALESAPPLAPEHLATALAGRDQAELFLRTAILLGWVDGDFSKKERALVGQYAKALKVSDKDLGTLEQGVKEYLVGQLAHLANTEGVAQVAKELGV